MRIRTSVPLLAITCGLIVAQPSLAAENDDDTGGHCMLPQGTISLVEKQLYTVVGLTDGNGGIFKPNRMWAAIVDREGHLCSVVKTGDAWPGSRAIAIAKAYTANGFSNDALALSTANLYGATQPGGSLYGLNNSNPFNPRFLEHGSGIGHTVGGVITFGGGVALYVGGKVIGGLGVSGDSACADHAIAYRMRKLAGLGSVPKGQGPNNTDNIIYAASSSPMGFEHPHCFASDLSASGIESVGR
ncbi:heme-binding protein [Paraburkholderia sp. RL17-368-BIF-A]|jgi:uncharacterized protein GlcG (DUF336 family)|uniref:GlcG/HbpS family heme-binding protein n=1 Tax=Paraburkholderia sp. RL17-368-BIF-A TaxID=3031628 RepID=UPI0006B3EB1E|nr:hypothetical protein AC233_30980 [Burkholderia sp. HB1]